jgi:hypothetical protein
MAVGIGDPMAGDGCRAAGDKLIPRGWFHDFNVGLENSRHAFDLAAALKLIYFVRH